VSDVIAGGLRDRLIEMAVRRVITEGLQALGWFSEGRAHAPIHVVAEPVDTDREVPANTLAITPDPFSSELIEMGSELSEDRRFYYVDFFAENTGVGRHLIGDVRDLLRGKMPGAGRSRSNLPVWDPRTPDATTPAFVADIEGVIVEEAREGTRAHQRHWFMCRFEVVDEW
jgi:hypothetical protein